MKDKYVLGGLGHALSPQIKELRKISEGKYKVFTEWPGHPELSSYIRYGFDSESKELDFIDFDGGPFMTHGFKLPDGCIVDHFEHDGDFNNIVVIIKEPNN